MRRAFACEQAASWAAGDRWTSVVLAGLLLLGPVPRLLRQSASASRLAASLLEVAALAAPGVLAHTAPAWYQPRRSWVVATCRLASIHLLVLVLPPSPPPTAAWGGAIRFLAQTRALGLPLFAWANRLPLQVGRLLAGGRTTARQLLAAPLAHRGRPPRPHLAVTGLGAPRGDGGGGPPVLHHRVPGAGLFRRGGAGPAAPNGPRH